jgi:hypothetical protein
VEARVVRTGPRIIHIVDKAVKHRPGSSQPPGIESFVQEKEDMKKLAVVLVAIGGLLSGCVAYEPADRGNREYRGERDRDRDGVPNRADRDRDGDGVRNSDDRRPDDPRRY